MWVSGELVACITAARPTSAAALRPSDVASTAALVSLSACAQCFLQFSGAWLIGWAFQGVPTSAPPRVFGALTRPLQRRHEHMRHEERRPHRFSVPPSRVPVAASPQLDGGRGELRAGGQRPM